MDTGWIPVFVLTVAECVVPAGKTVCQKQEVELQFLTEAECNQALEQMVAVKDASKTIIVDKDKTHCAPSARQVTVYESLADLDPALVGDTAWIAPESPEARTDSMRAAHQSRLEGLPSCDESKGVAPCKIGEIIIEEAEAPKQVPIWRRDN